MSTWSSGGWAYRVRRQRLGDLPAWDLCRRREDGWEIMHRHDELPVHPVDLIAAHHYTSTFPQAHFRHGLMLTRHDSDRHTSLTEATATVRRPGRPTEHREISLAEVAALLEELKVPLTDDERGRLIERLARLRSARAGQP